MAHRRLGQEPPLQGPCRGSTPCKTFPRLYPATSRTFWEIWVILPGTYPREVTVIDAINRLPLEAPQSSLQGATAPRNLFSSEEGQQQPELPQTLACWGSQCPWSGPQVSLQAWDTVLGRWAAEGATGAAGELCGRPPFWGATSGLPARLAGLHMGGSVPRTPGTSTWPRALAPSLGSPCLACSRPPALPPATVSENPPRVPCTLRQPQGGLGAQRGEVGRGTQGAASADPGAPGPAGVGEAGAREDGRPGRRQGALRDARTLGAGWGGPARARGDPGSRPPAQGRGGRARHSPGRRRGAGPRCAAPGSALGARGAGEAGRARGRGGAGARAVPGLPAPRAAGPHPGLAASSSSVGAQQGRRGERPPGSLPGMGPRCRRAGPGLWASPVRPARRPLSRDQNRCQEVPLQGPGLAAAGLRSTGPARSGYLLLLLVHLASPRY